MKQLKDFKMRKQPIILALILLFSCSPLPNTTKEFSFRVSCIPQTKSSDPRDEDMISDLNIFIFNHDGSLEERKYLPVGRLERDGSDVVFPASLIISEMYSVYVCANIGYALHAGSEAELKSLRYHLAYPDEYSKGLPMTGCLKNIIPSSGNTRIGLERMMSRLAIVFDRSFLEEGTEIWVKRVSVGNCPRSALLFGESLSESSEDMFITGFSKEGASADPLNRDISGGKSREIRLYMLENLHEKEDRLSSFVELELEYSSKTMHNKPGEYLKYRFKLGEIRRNTDYSFVVTPEGGGLNGDSWRVDKEALEVKESARRFDLHPAAYNVCSVSDTFHLWCDVFPEDAPVEIELLAYDDDERVAALYDYEIDKNGHGLRLMPHKDGTALIYIKAGPPVSKDTLAMVVFNPDTSP